VSTWLKWVSTKNRKKNIELEMCRNLIGKEI
jgi:hypothetical protein